MLSGQNGVNAEYLKVNIALIEVATPSWCKKIEPRSEKTGLRGFRPSRTQTRLYSYRKWLEA